MPADEGPRPAAAQIGAAIVASYLLDRLSARAPGMGDEGPTVGTLDASVTRRGEDAGSRE